MISYPIQFSSLAQSTEKLQEAWKISSGQYQTFCAVPPEFEGPGGGFSPEDLFAQALTNCLLATFKVYAHHSKLVYRDIQVKSDLLVDLDEAKKPVMKKISFAVKISGAEKPDKAKALLERALRSGFILNSVKTEIEVQSLEVT